jgi:hypothetical protein
MKNKRASQIKGKILAELRARAGTPDADIVSLPDGRVVVTLEGKPYPFTPGLNVWKTIMDIADRHKSRQEVYV